MRITSSWRTASERQRQLGDLGADEGDRLGGPELEELAVVVERPGPAPGRPHPTRGAAHGRVIPGPQSRQLCPLRRAPPGRGGGRGGRRAPRAAFERYLA